MGRSRIAILLLGGIVAVSAVGGGVALMAGIAGNRFPVAYLVGTPFTSYLVPGLILAVAVGGAATIATLLAIAGSPRAGGASVLAGAVLMGWIAGEVFLLPPQAHSAMELAFFVAGAAMFVLGLSRQRGRTS